MSIVSTAQTEFIFMSHSVLSTTAVSYIRKSAKDFSV